MKQSAPKDRTRQRIKPERTFGDNVLHSLNDFHQAVGRGEPITVHTIRLRLDPAKCGPADVRRSRTRLNISQRVLAQLMGVSPKTVQSWEQGTRPVPGPAARLIEEFDRNPGHWTQLLRAAVNEQLRETR